MGNKDVQLHDIQGNNLFPLAHKDDNGDVISDMVQVGSEGAWQYIKLKGGIAIIWTQIRHQGISYSETWADHVFTKEQQMPTKPAWFTQINITGSAVSDSMSQVLGELQIRGGGKSYVFIRPNTVTGGGIGWAHLQAIGTWDDSSQEG